MNNGTRNLKRITQTLRDGVDGVMVTPTIAKHRPRKCLDYWAPH